MNCNNKKYVIFLLKNINFQLLKDAPIVKILKISQEELLPGNYIEFQCLVESEPPVKSYK